MMKLQDKLLRQLLRLVPSLSLVNLPGTVATLPNVAFPDEVKQELSLSRQLVRGLAIYTLFLHSDIVHRRKMCSFTALGLTEHEASGTKSLLDPHDLALMEKVFKERKERTVLAGNLAKRRTPTRVAGRRAVAMVARVVAVAAMLLASKIALPPGSRE